MGHDKRTVEFTEWWAAHGLILHKIANSFAPPADRDDLMQELLLSVWRALPDFRGDAKPSTFAYRVAHNCALTWVRGVRRRKLREAQLADARQATAAIGPGVTDRRLEILYECIRDLSPVDRSLITMSLDGLTHGEMAEVLGVRENAISVRLHRVRRQLAEKMKGRMQ